MPTAQRALACLLITLARCCHGPGSGSAVRLMSACESRNNATVVTRCTHCVWGLATDLPRVTRFVESSGLNSSIRPVPRWLWKTVQPSPYKDTTAAATLPSSISDPSIHLVQVPDPAVHSFLLAHHSTTHLAAASSSSIVVLTAGSFPGSCQHIISALLLRAYTIAATLPTSAPVVG